MIIRCLPFCRAAQVQKVSNDIILTPGSQRSQCSMAQLRPALKWYAVGSEHASREYAHHLASRK